MATGRTEYSARNAAVGMTAKVLGILFGYVTRIVFIRMLSGDLVGINGLLSNVLGAFSLPMLGVDTALVYAMYDPVARSDEEKQRSLMRLYSRVYLVFGLVITAAGLALYPFLPALLGRSDIDGLGLIYILFLASTVSSYVWASRGMVFLVYQRNYVNELIGAAALLVQNLGQCAVLVLTRNYLLFLTLNIVCNLGRNLYTHRRCEREYPFLRGEKAAPLPAGERLRIRRDIRAMLIHKCGTVVINSTDNLLLTNMFSLMAVGQYANYYLIIGSVEQVLKRIIYGVTASVGNMGATEDRIHLGGVFRVCVFTAFLLYGVAASVLFSMLDGFIGLSFGADYVLPQSLTPVVCLNLYINGLRNATLVFRDSLGLFRRDRYKTVVEALMNLGVSILLARRMGMVGVFLGTTVSVMLVSFWIEPLILYRDSLREPLAPYFARYALYLISAAAVTALARFLCRAVPTGLWGVMLRLVISGVVSSSALLLLWHRSPEFQTLRRTFFPLARERLSHLRHAGKDTNAHGTQ